MPNAKTARFGYASRGNRVNGLSGGEPLKDKRCPLFLALARYRTAHADPVFVTCARGNTCSPDRGF